MCRDGSIARTAPPYPPLDARSPPKTVHGHTSSSTPTHTHTHTHNTYATTDTTITVSPFTILAPRLDSATCLVGDALSLSFWPGSFAGVLVSSSAIARLFLLVCAIGTVTPLRDKPSFIHLPNAHNHVPLVTFNSCSKSRDAIVSDLVLALRVSHGLQVELRIVTSLSVLVASHFWTPPRASLHLDIALLEFPSVLVRLDFRLVAAALRISVASHPSPQAPAFTPVPVFWSVAAASLSCHTLPHDVMASRQEGTSSRATRRSSRHVGSFVIDREIGKGSFAQVYMGWHKVSFASLPGPTLGLATNKHKESKAAVAIKSVELERLNKKLKENLYGEIQILKTLRHPHIVALHDCVESSTHINLVMEYCELGDLSLFIKKRDKLITHPATHEMARKYPCAPNSGLHEVVIRHFLKQLCSALEFLRAKNYVHRDVKPQNLLLLPAQAFRAERALPIMQASRDSLIPISGLASLPMLKLADFGFARVLPSTSLADTLCGSPLYMAPEILRYERYDAKADLWSVGTVLYEMITGRPPFRARNHVELLRKIEAAEDIIKFPREVIVTPDLKALVRALLKRSPVERLSFENFFAHTVVTADIPGLVEDDIPKPPKRELETIRQGEAMPSSPRTQMARQLSDDLGSPAEATRRRQSQPVERRPSTSPRDSGHGLGIQRPVPIQSHSAPNHPRAADRSGREPQPSSLRVARQPSDVSLSEEEKAAQDVMFERDYVVVERRHVEVNALADELAANERLGQNNPSARASPMQRRYTQQGSSTSTTGAIPTPASRTALVAQGRAGQDRRSSYEKALSASPGSASSAISKAIQDASLRLFGYKVNPIRQKGPSPPLYQPFPAYPTPTSAGLLGDGKTSQVSDEDARAAQAIEEFATRSDCVYGFAEVKYKQLVPLAPSMDYGLGGVVHDEVIGEDDGLTVEATVALSEEALVLFVKSLTLLARAMDIASLWWSKKSRAESSIVSQTLVQRINAVVQWVRQRFNEVLEKSEVVRLKLSEAQKLLPEDHPGYPSSQGEDSIASSAGGAKQVYLTPGISAEKLMYDRALEMSRAAAIDEVTNENLPGCEISYLTAIRMLEAVLDSGEEITGRRVSSGKEPARDTAQEGSDLDMEEEAHVRKMITMITGRLTMVRKKQQMIAEANSKTPHLSAMRRLSGDVTPRSVPSYGST
ncbi:serine/threonine protein kinase (Pdd7p), putative [Cordyceps militaris CM01]|uniref:non-specific serine/threonine protein kinase n=1 Tax=Cordyceps militaris (strain CM01) TaxID=983644 RepID=G3JMI0_CORMM|nr:serine/threonine protein kinase (Pdd7p), putative [Cordyceps militaris CM01]EGX90859.1 serine/threonine protein kinase (Pdd7p), putative [Cordyceps militaris CM01]